MIDPPIARRRPHPQAEDGRQDNRIDRISGLSSICGKGVSDCRVFVSTSGRSRPEASEVRSALLDSALPPALRHAAPGDWRIRMRKNVGRTRVRPKQNTGGVAEGRMTKSEWGNPNDERSPKLKARMTKRRSAREEGLTHAKSHQPSAFSYQPEGGNGPLAIRH